MSQADIGWICDSVTQLNISTLDWKNVEIGEICHLINGRAFKPSEWRENGLPIIRIQNLNNEGASFNYFDGEIDEKHRINEGDLLFAWSGTPGTSFGAHVWKGKESVLNQHIFKVTFQQNRINRDFLRYAINQKLDELISGAHGGVGLRHVTKGKLEKTKISFPPSAEQQQIAAKLDDLLAQVDTLKTRLDTIPKIIKRFRQSVLAVAVSGKLTEDWRGDIAYHDVEGISVPVSWTVKQAQESCVKVQSGSTPRDNPFDQNGTIPFLKVYNIVDQKIDFNYKPQFITKEVHEQGSKRSIAYPNDVLMNIVGPPLGKIALLTDQYPEWNLNQAITFFRADESQLNFQYLYYVLCEGALVRKVMPDTKGSVGQVNISLSQCREALITLPPIEEQSEIVRRVDQLFTYADQIEQRVKDAQARVNHLTQSILAKAFRGELTAEWRERNPDLISGENSAEALLAKIQAERECAPTKKPRTTSSA